MHKKRSMQVIAEMPAKVPKIPVPKQMSSCLQDSSDKALFRERTDHMPARVMMSGGTLDYCAKRAVRLLGLPTTLQGTPFVHRYGTMCSVKSPGGE